MIWLKRFIFTIWLSKRGGTFHRPFFLEKWILWKSSILKRFIFLVFEYGNLIGVKTHRDRLKNLGKALLNRRFRFIDFVRGWGPHKCFGCCPVVALSFFYLLCPRGFENFPISALDCPFRVFTLESFFFLFSFFFIFFLWLSYYALDNSKFIPNKWKIDQDFLLAEENSLID